MTPLASLARSCYAAALAAVHPRNLMGKLSFNNEGVGSHGVWLEPKGKLVLVSVGKAGATMAEAFLLRTKRQPEEIFVLVPKGTAVADTLAPFTRFGSHPGVSEENAAATANLKELLAVLTPEDGVVFLVSGGASALLSLPVEGVTVEELSRLTWELSRRGATIRQLNIVRKHLGAVLGGKLASICPGQILTFVLSDVPGNNLDLVASGPTLPDPSTCDQALEILKRFGLHRIFPHIGEILLSGKNETPKPGDPLLNRAKTLLLGSNQEALDAMKATLAGAGFRSWVLTSQLRGEAREVGRTLGTLIRVAAPGIALLAAGETTVTVKGPGEGGRNLELALGAAESLAGHQHRCLLAAGTDGVDGSSPAAGAVVDGQTLWRGQKAGRDPEKAFQANDSWGFFVGLPETIMVGPTGTNVADVVVALSAPQASWQLPLEGKPWQRPTAPSGLRQPQRTKP